MKKHLLPLVLLLAGLSASAQPNKKIGPALTNFLNTEFMTKFRDLRINAESAVLNVQSNSNLQKSDVFKLRSAYDQTATRANQLLNNVKQDFMNSKKLKSIAEFPDMYSDGLGYKLQDISDFYASNFQQALADASITKDEVDGGAFFLLIIELIGLTKGLTSYFSDIRREARQYTEAHLQEHLVLPYRWRYWDELAGSTSGYEKFEKAPEVQLNEAQRQEKLDQQLQKVSQTISTMPQNTDGTTNTDPGFNPPSEGEMPSDSTSGLRYDDWTPTETPTSPQPAPDSTGTKPGNLKGKIQNPKQQQAPAEKSQHPSKPAKKEAGGGSEN
ncbi:MAG: hypothetical protein ACKVU2_03660 [Saprospiraceae bacterium]